MFEIFQNWFANEPAALLAALEARIQSLEGRALSAETKLAALAPVPNQAPASPPPAS